MFVKVYEYHIQPEKIEEFFKIQERAGEIYRKYLESHTIYLKKQDNETKWMEISRYKDESEYKKSIRLVNEHEEIQHLFSDFQSLLVPDSELVEEDFLQIEEKNSLGR
jgi:hydroxymethylpyrimidine pyrophosphatase-like HAD family hydrolase